MKSTLTITIDDNIDILEAEFEKETGLDAWERYEDANVYSHQFV